MFLPEYGQMIPKKDAYLKLIQKLTVPVSRLKGVGPKRATLFARKGIHTILDLLFFTPVRYEDRTFVCPISEVEEGMPVLVKGKVLSGGEERFYPSRRRLFKIRLRDERAVLDLIWFNYKKPHLSRFATQGMELLAYGTVYMSRGRRQMVHPEIKAVDPHEVGADSDALGFYPVYSSVAGISANLLRSSVRRALDNHLDALLDPIPAEITRALRLPALTEAIKFVHLPARDSSPEHLNRLDTPFHRRLSFDRFFLVMLIMAFRRKSRDKSSCAGYMTPPGLMADLEDCFPFKLTSHQIMAVQDIVKDLTAGKPMNRLLMGDVGCGKTAVAAVAAYLGVQNNRQVAIMAPTQVLASQHLEYFSELSRKMGLRPALLTSALKKAARQEIYEKIGNGSYNLILGTHSLIQEDLVFSDLGLVIIDEQHRFGVKERALMDRKGKNPHILVMTATPIPRTLAITVYGDMDISVIRGYPEGRLPVGTEMVTEGDKRRLLESLIRRLSEGEQAFVICPVIEGSEAQDLKNAVEMAEKLRKVLSPPFRVGLVHGRLSPDEREAVMTDFRKGLIGVLVGTTVIEVGVHVPKATVMIIEHPERFGLAQLHQLRGRVGRGTKRGICYLVVSKGLSERAISRLKIFVENHDGFEIAQKDLEQRGHGELTGMRQTGIGELDVMEMMRKPDLLSVAKQAAQRLIAVDPELLNPENHPLRTFVESILARPLDL